VPISESTARYLPGLAAHLFAPQAGSRSTLVVLVPGGAWLTADPTGLIGLARFLAQHGVLAAAVEVRAAVDGVVYPIPVDDVICAVAFAESWAASNGNVPTHVIALGHSTGAHLAALSALVEPEEIPSCPDPVRLPDGLIGLAGTYDVSMMPEIAVNLFGVPAETSPQLWESGNPISKVGLRPEVPVLLLHGDADELVPVWFTNEFGGALEDAGHVTVIEIVSGAGHHDIYQPETSGDLILTWLRSLDG
jgi:acetyl esterase/lipase